ncbi:MAG: TylF/MycF/NovP-related O-methyltransferase [Acetobacteraceae bacterium]
MASREGFANSLRIFLGKVAAHLIVRHYHLVFVVNRLGQPYGIGPRRKFALLRKIQRNVRNTSGGTTVEQLLLLAEELFKIPPSLKGDVVECGCWRGTSSAALSLVCALVGRKLHVCDSFEGLPEPRNDEERFDIHAGSGERYYVWEKGEYSGSLELVRNTISTYGDISVCAFVKGYFRDSLKTFDPGPIVFVFEDADLASSVEDCLTYLWPIMPHGARFYSHEPWSEHVVALFYDRTWWREKFDTHIPGFYGSGRGIMAGLQYSQIGYTEKYDAAKLKELGTKIIQAPRPAERTV